MTTQLSSDVLTRALLNLTAQGTRPRCGDPSTSTLWMSDDPDDRKQAAHWCTGCPVLTACGEAAEANGERWGVWGGRDRTPSKESGGMSNTSPGKLAGNGRPDRRISNIPPMADPVFSTERV